MYSITNFTNIKLVCYTSMVISNKFPSYLNISFRSSMFILKYIYRYKIRNTTYRKVPSVHLQASGYYKNNKKKVMSIITSVPQIQRSQAHASPDTWHQRYPLRHCHLPLPPQRLSTRILTCQVCALQDTWHRGCLPRYHH